MFLSRYWEYRDLHPFQSVCSGGCTVASAPFLGVSSRAQDERGRRGDDRRLVPSQCPLVETDAIEEARRADFLSQSFRRRLDA